MTFKKAVEKTPDVEKGYKRGLDAINEVYLERIDVSHTKLLNGSVDIDTCTMRLYPCDNRWDYAISYNQKVYFIEFHTTNVIEITTMLNKLKWIKRWLAKRAPDVKRLNVSKPYLWIQSRGVAFLPTSPQYKLIIQNGLKPVSYLKLP